VTGPNSIAVGDLTGHGNTTSGDLVAGNLLGGPLDLITDTTTATAPSPNLPESPLTILLPLSALVLIGGFVVAQRGRRQAL
jgi:hypothetical protein